MKRDIQPAPYSTRSTNYPLVFSRINLIHISKFIPLLIVKALLLKFLLTVLFACCLSGCFEMNEEIEVQKNGSGNLSVNMDMGQVLEMMQAFMSPEDIEKADLGKAKDTVIQMKDLVDTSTTLSPE